MLRLDTSVGGLEFFAPCCLAGKKKCLRMLPSPQSLNEGPSGTFGLVSSRDRRRLRSSRPTLRSRMARPDDREWLRECAARSRTSALFTENQTANSSPNRLACCGSLASRKRPASSKQAFSFCFPLPFRAQCASPEFGCRSSAGSLPCAPPLGDWGGERRAPADVFRGRHGIITHQFGALSADADSKCLTRSQRTRQGPAPRAVIS